MATWFVGKRVDSDIMLHRRLQEIDFRLVSLQCIGNFWDRRGECVIMERGDTDLASRLSKCFMRTRRLSFLGRLVLVEISPGSVSLLFSTTVTSSGSYVPAELSQFCPGALLSFFLHDFSVVDLQGSNVSPRDRIYMCRNLDSGQPRPSVI